MSINNKNVELLSYKNNYDLRSIQKSGFFCCIVNPFCTNIHSHDFYELTYCISGHATHLVNNQKVSVSAGSLFILRPGDIHHFTDYKSANALTICIHPDIFDAFTKAYNLDDYDVFYQTHMSDLPLQIKVSSSDAFQLESFCENIIASTTPNESAYLKLLLGFSLCVIGKYRISSSQNVPKTFRQALTKMNQLDNVRGGVKVFLAISNLSHAQLCRLTKKHLNMTPHEYVNSIRMKWAHSLITGTDKDMEHISELVGFSSYSHFYKLFKITYGISPASLRNSSE